MCEARWRASWRALGVPEPPHASWRTLQQRYAEPQRAYHTLSHICECLAQWDRVHHLAARPAEVEMAIWCHDAVYDPYRSDNEALSAQWARAVLMAAGVEADAVQRVADLINGTAHSHPPDDPDAALLLDIDLAILGADPARFDQYEQQIRREYAWVPWSRFCRRRAAVLRMFLQRPTIYWTEHFVQRLEHPARINLQRSLARLRAGHDPEYK